MSEDLRIPFHPYPLAHDLGVAFDVLLPGIAKDAPKGRHFWHKLTHERPEARVPMYMTACINNDGDYFIKVTFPGNWVSLTTDSVLGIDWLDLANRMERARQKYFWSIL